MTFSRALSHHYRMMLAIVVFVVMILELFLAFMVAHSHSNVPDNFAGTLPDGVFLYEHLRPWENGANVKQQIAGTFVKQDITSPAEVIKQDVALSAKKKVNMNWQVVNYTRKSNSRGNTESTPVTPLPAQQPEQSKQVTPSPAFPPVQTLKDTPSPAHSPPRSQKDTPSPAHSPPRSQKDTPSPAHSPPRSQKDTPSPAHSSLKSQKDTPLPVQSPLHAMGKQQDQNGFSVKTSKNREKKKKGHGPRQKDNQVIKEIFGHLVKRNSTTNKRGSSFNQINKINEIMLDNTKENTTAQNNLKFNEPHQPFHNIPIQGNLDALCANLDKISYQTQHFCLEDVANLTQQYFKMTRYGWCYVKGAEMIDKRKECYCVSGWYGQHCSMPEVVEKSDYPYEYGVAVLNRPRRVIMAFPFNFEFELLEARLEEFGNLVDVFVILESNFTASGKQKPLYLLDNLKKGYIKTYQHKILHVTLDFFPDEAYKDGWVVDELIRHYLGNQALQRIHGLRPDDIFVISDTDELPVWDTIFFLKFHYGYPEPIGFHLRHNVFGFFWLGNDLTSHVFGACSVAMLERVFAGNPYHLRDATRYMQRNPEGVNMYKYKYGGRVREWSFGTKEHPIGWHCSWCFEAERIQHKLLSAHLSDLPRWGSDPSKTDLQYINKLIQNGLWFDDINKLVPVNNTEDRWYAPSYFTDDTANVLMKLQ